MALDLAGFRDSYPEFTDAVKYPDAMITRFLTVAVSMVNADRWGTLVDYGVGLVTAHRCAIAMKNQRDAAFGKAPGAASGPVSSKAVDKVNISYDTSTAAEEGAGWWNMTIYGQEYIRQARLMGAGGMLIGGPSPDDFQARAYVGPIW